MFWHALLEDFARPLVVNLIVPFIVRLQCHLHKGVITKGEFSLKDLLNLSNLYLGNGRNTVSRVLFRRRELTEFYGKLGEFSEKLGEFAFAHK